MSEEETADLAKSWIFIDPIEKSHEDKVSGVEVVSEDDTNESHVDSDTDSISVISESCCSYKTDEEEFVPATNLAPEEPSDLEISKVKWFETLEMKTPETPEVKPAEVKVESLKYVLLPENGRAEKCLYFATSAICAIILIVFSVAIQQYLSNSLNVNNFNNEFDQQNDFSSISHYVQNVKTQDIQIEGQPKKSCALKREDPVKLEKLQNKIKLNQIKLKNYNKLVHDKLTPPNIQNQNNDLTVEADVKSNFKLNKNKNSAMKFNKENSDETNKPTENDEHKKTIKPNNIDKINKSGKKLKNLEKQVFGQENQADENYNKKLKALKIKENYLREKEKFLIEKEHDLSKKEIRLNKEKKNHEKKTDYKKEKEHKYNSDEYIKEKKNKFKPHKKYIDEGTNPKNNKKYKNKEEKKNSYFQYQDKLVDDEPHKKRNLSGQWYINMHKARNNIRQKEHASDWVFDRAHLRSMRRNKAHWYFQWMVDRARRRVK